MSRWLATACALLGLVVPSMGQENTYFRPATPILVAKGEDYFIHYLPTSRETQVTSSHVPLGTETDAQFLHTRPSTAEMKVIMKMRTDRHELLGYLTDHERLYVVLRSQLTYKPQGQPEQTEIRYQILVYWLSDGEQVAREIWFDTEVPEKLPKGKPVAAGGPIDLAESGVKCFGRTFRFDGKKLARPAAK